MTVFCKSLSADEDQSLCIEGPCKLTGISDRKLSNAKCRGEEEAVATRSSIFFFFFVPCVP